MNQIPVIETTVTQGLLQAAMQAGHAIAPAWPLAATVAVNPFLGQANRSFAETAELLGRLAGVDIAPPRSWFAERLAQGLITLPDLSAALAGKAIPGIAEPEDLAKAARQEKRLPAPIPDVARLAAAASGIDWPRIVSDRLSVFATGFFDEGQALWTASRQAGVYASWQLFATHDLTPEIAGLRGFAAEVAAMPRTAVEVIETVGARLRLGSDPGHYFHQLLLGLGGTAQHARHLQFVAERDGGEDGTLIDLLAIRLVYEHALYRLYEASIKEAWSGSLASYRAEIIPSRDCEIDAALLEAAEHGENGRRMTQLAQARLSNPLGLERQGTRPSLQAAFCIDVRSETIRRALETVDANIATLGFAGFFGIGISHRSKASDVPGHRMPVLLPAARISCEAVPVEEEKAARYSARAARAFSRFRQAAVSSFAFMEAMGPVYAAKLVGQTFGGGGSKVLDTPKPVLDLPLAERVAMAEATLRAMSLTENFAPLVLLAGHGATSANNPFLSALQCGACGGHSGDVNARLLADMLNDPDVRGGLGGCGITIPGDTLFLAGLHDTTTDEIRIFEGDADLRQHVAVVQQLQAWLRLASRLAQAERRKRLPRGAGTSPEARSRDWSETRPEWGLAGCTHFIVGPRALTAGLTLENSTFLHDYVWQKDRDFRVLELILTAPVVVASWINLQYFGSTTAPSLFGSGNKLLHNVVSGLGVLEGNSGPLRAGLPFQSVHDGTRAMHEPLRLTVTVAAPVSAVSDVIRRHQTLRFLLDNRWLQLCVLQSGDGPALRYAGHLDWTPMNMLE